MFNEKKTLIVVYKDEMLTNQLKKLVESSNGIDSEAVIGLKNGSINIVSWTEKVWMGNKKAGNINSKVLFLDDIKGTDKLIPVIDVKFDEFGVKYGWAGNQAILYADVKALNNRNDYLLFLDNLSALPVPEMIKNTNKPKGSKQAKGVESNNNDSLFGTSNHAIADESPPKNQGIFNKAKAALATGADLMGTVFEKIGNDANILVEDLFRNKALVKRQMLFYGVVNLYNNDLDSFMFL